MLSAKTLFDIISNIANTQTGGDVDNAMKILSNNLETPELAYSTFKKVLQSAESTNAAKKDVNKLKQQSYAALSPPLKKNMKTYFDEKGRIKSGTLNSSMAQELQNKLYDAAKNASGEKRFKLEKMRKKILDDMKFGMFPSPEEFYKRNNKE